MRHSSGETIGGVFIRSSSFASSLETARSNLRVRRGSLPVDPSPGHLLRCRACDPLSHLARRGLWLTLRRLDRIPRLSRSRST